MVYQRGRDRPGTVVAASLQLLAPRNAFAVAGRFSGRDRTHPLHADHYWELGEKSHHLYSQYPHDPTLCPGSHHRIRHLEPPFEKTISSPLGWLPCSPIQV